MTTGLTLEHGDSVITATIERSGGNQLTQAICRELTDILLGPPDDVHILHVRTTGEAFCLGRDRAAEEPSALRHEVDALVGLNQALKRSTLISVTGVQGDAAGFGVGLAALSDVTIVAESVHFWFPEVEIDLAPTVVLSWLPGLIGPKRAFHLTATGRRVSASEAADIGLVTRFVPDASLDASIAEEIDHLRVLSPRVLAQIKAFVADTRGMSVDQAYALATERLILGSMVRRRE